MEGVDTNVDQLSNIKCSLLVDGEINDKAQDEPSNGSGPALKFSDRFDNDGSGEYYEVYVNYKVNGFELTLSNHWLIVETNR
jgi:hypothetical protein